MKWWIGFAVIGMASLVWGCQNPQNRFCKEAVSELCSRCESCGNDFKPCGLTQTSDRAECESTLMGVCAAYDAEFKHELSRTCLEQLNHLTCDQLRSNGKPDTCNRLF